MNEFLDDDDFWRPPHVMEPHATFRHKVRADQLLDAITPAADVFVLAHFGIPRIKREDWRLHIDGLVPRPVVLAFDDLAGFPKIEIEAFIKCAGLPHDATIATRAVSNARWAGADLRAVLDHCGLDSSAKYLWAYGPDQGTYARWSALRYVKDHPLSRLASQGAVLAYELNGEPLSAEHGFPVRLLVPGYYGTNSVKWLCRLDAAAERAPDIFTNELYNDPGDGGTRQPVWAVPPEALVVSPADHNRIAVGPLEIRGWCWGDQDIAFVEVSLNGGATWRRAEIGERHEKGWQSFRLTCAIAAGSYSIVARATDVDGQTQPLRDARNSVHKIDVTVS
jgi:DMSO/TMAO reductase YedYZ molybdopterin-dependent catalytic subunit